MSERPSSDRQAEDGTVNKSSTDSQLMSDEKSPSRRRSSHQKGSRSGSRSSDRRSSLERRSSSRHRSSRDDGTLSRRRDAYSKSQSHRTSNRSTRGLSSRNHQDKRRHYSDGSSRRSYRRIKSERIRTDKSSSRHSSNHKPTRKKSTDNSTDPMNTVVNEQGEVYLEETNHGRSSEAAVHEIQGNEALHTLYSNGVDGKAKMRPAERALTPGIQHVKSNRTLNTLYVDEADAKAKTMGAISERASRPGVEQMDSKRTLHTLYDTDADAKAKASMVNMEPAKIPGVQQVFDQTSSSKHTSTTTATLYGTTSDADTKAKAKASMPSASFPGVDRIFSPSSSPIWQRARLSRGNLERMLDPSISTLYGDNDAKAKAKASNDKPASNPGVETVIVHNNNSTHTSSISTLYGSEDSKAKSKATRSFASNSPGVESVRTNRTVSTLYGHDADAKANARMGSSALAAIPGFQNMVSRLTMRSLSSSASRVTDEILEDEVVQEPVARRVSMESTVIVSESLSESERRGMVSEAMEGFQMPNDPETGSKRHSDKLKKRANDNVNTPPKTQKNRKSLEDTSNRSRKKRRGMFLLLLLLLLLLIIGGAAAVWYFWLRDNENGGGTDDVSTNTNIQDSTDSSLSPTSPTVMPTGSSGAEEITKFPSLSPSQNLMYDPPSDLDCQDIAANQTITGRENMEKADFELGLEVVLPENSAFALSGPLLQALLDAIQQKILPSLVGCSINDGDLVEDWRFVIFDAFVTGRVPQDKSCTGEALKDLDCHYVAVELNLFLKGSVRFLDIVTLISAEGENIANSLGLGDLFEIIKLIGAESLIPTDAPTRMPSAVPSFTPTSAPTVQGSFNPTDIPSALPTRGPTGEPSPFPSSIPSLAPSLAPSLQPTELPSESPSVRPTNLFSGTPTVPPTPAPTSSPSAAPSGLPSGLPSGSPTATPSGSPTVSVSPSKNPSSTPSAIPSATPSDFPSSAPSAAPSVTTFHYVQCGRSGRCGGPASVQNSNYSRLGGTGSDIAVRCCSDTHLPGFSTRGGTCPYAESFIGGTCYTQKTFHEAEALCAGVGARLCTLAEINGNCARGTGCSHDRRWVWTSDPGP